MTRNAESANCIHIKYMSLTLRIYRKVDKEKLEKKIKDHDEDKLKNTRILQASVDEKTELIAQYMKKLEDLEQNSEKHYDNL